MTAPNEPWQPTGASTACPKCGVTAWGLTYNATGSRFLNNPDSALTTQVADKLILQCRRCNYEKLAAPKKTGV